jgi:hypothetical protein
VKATGGGRGRTAGSSSCCSSSSSSSSAHSKGTVACIVTAAATAVKAKKGKPLRKEKKRKNLFIHRWSYPAQPLRHIIIFINYFGLSIIVELLVLKMRAFFYNPFIIIYCIHKFMLDNTKTWFTLKHGIHFIFPWDADILNNQS